MHELSIAVAVVEQVEAALREEGRDPRGAGGPDAVTGRAVEAVTLRVGELAGVVPEALDFAFALATEGTALAGSRLLVDTVEGRGRCDGCGREAPTGMPPVLWCGECGATLTLLAGRELDIVRVVLADGPPGTGGAGRGPASAVAGPPTRDEEAHHVPHH
ncbi:hydrogenase maturation nickel metallochaperone HypA [Streptomyces sp. NPDC048566]|uniref:hydrogenase maturation nickel metallochaperone HypA/HybF n=1 Tax=Streptomyces sp. NPDC048566 TaxID=3365569 RepID=UPI003716130F